MKASDRLDATFAALADPTRRAILARLTNGQLSVSGLCKPFAMSQPAVSKHLRVLERAGLISRGRDAQRNTSFRTCRILNCKLSHFGSSLFFDNNRNRIYSRNFRRQQLSIYANG